MTGTLVARPTEGPDGAARIRVDGHPDWWAVVPASSVQPIEEES